MIGSPKSAARVLAILVMLLLHPAISVIENADLEPCEFDTEVQFYTADIDVLNLPEACYEQETERATIDHLTTIGFLIQVRE